MTVPDTSFDDPVSLGADVEAEGDGVAEGVTEEPEPDVEPPPVRTPVMASPIVSSRFPPLAEADGLGVDAPPPEDVPDVLFDGVGAALSPEPESGEEVVPDVLSEVFPELAFGDAEDVGSGVSADLEGLAEADDDGDGEAEASLESLELSRASTHFWYSSTVRFLDDGEWSAALASVGVSPMPMRTAVGIAARAIAFPAGMWNLVNSGFLGAAWRGPVLTRDASTSAPWVTSSAGTVPPVRPVGRARS
ncbi:hypothetical protein ACWEWI_30115 [Streptomyces sp. NPDC003753]|uniref:hypothetical protein n=1 Tax=unclassified Streptomyces TaxID=2593676 RepID=UPI0035B51145